MELSKHQFSLNCDVSSCTRWAIKNMCIRTLSILPDKFDDTALSCDLSSSRPSPKTQFPGVIPRGRQVLEEYVGSWKMKEDQMNLSA